MKTSLMIGLSLFLICCPSDKLSAQAIIADHNCIGEFYSIYDTIIAKISSDFHIYYVHTSHGSQIWTGIEMLEIEENKYTPPLIWHPGDDLGYNGDTSWVPRTRVYLEENPECNMAMFSWCGGVSDNTPEGIDIYLNKMQELENDYPAVIFIYMTGHLDGSGPDGNLYLRNNQIRDTCLSRGKILFDFADIESYDPDGTYYPDEGDGCTWCYDWCATHICPTCGSCAHSHCFNCYQKGKAWWWMMAKIVGWEGQLLDTCGNINGDGQVNVGDVVFLVNHIFNNGPTPVPFEHGNVNCDGAINIGDVVYMVNHVFSDGPLPCADCPKR
jgi:hypothetical protein